MGVLSKNFILGDDEELWHYNCLDCVRTREVGEVELETIAQQGLEEVHAFQQELLWPVLAAMNRGVRVSTRERERLALHLTEEIQKRHDWLHKVLGHPLNPASVKQMRALFYDDFKQPVVMKRGKAGAPPTVSCDDEALTTIAKREPLLKPITNRIKEIRSLKVLYATFVMMPLDVDGRMRTSYNICGTVEFRFSSSANAFGTGGNLQNVPAGGPDEDRPEFILPNVRKMYVPDEGHTFFDTDLSKADLRIVVRDSGEREMQAMLDEGRDPYIESAREFYRDPTITKLLPSGDQNPKYKLFKSFAHGTHYLGTPVGLARRLGLTVHDADRTQRWYFGKYPAIKAWQERFTEEVKRTRRVSNAWGYHHVFFGRVDDAMVREAIAWRPASTVAILTNKIWVRIHKHVPQVKVLLQVHDSLAGQFPTVVKAQCVAAIKEQANIPIPYADPLFIPVGIKTSDVSWGDCA